MSFKDLHDTNDATPYDTLARLNRELMAMADKAALVYFDANWCDDCERNEKDWEAFVGKAPNEDVPLMRVATSIGKPDWKYETKERNYGNPYRQKPLEVQSVPTAAGVRYSRERYALEVVSQREENPTEENLYRLWEVLKDFNSLSTM